MRLLLLLSVLILLRYNECAAKKNVLFIYDKIDTTADDKDQLSRKVQTLSSQLFKDGLDFQFKIIYPYYKSYIAEISNSATPSINWHCDSRIKEQSTLKSLQTWLQASPSNSVINVITNVTEPSDENSILDNILEQIQIKRTEINFVMGLDSSFQTEPPEEYRLITSISNGFVFNLDGFRHHQFTDSMHFVDHKVNLVTIDEKYDEKHCITLDSLMTASMLMASKNFKEHNVIKSNDRAIIKLIYTHNDEWTCTIKYNNEICFEPKKHTQKKLQSSSFHSLRLFGLSDFNFDYGFSKDAVRSSREIYIRPVKGKSNKIYVQESSSNQDFQASFQSFKILFINGTSGDEIPLYRVPKTNLYAGLFQQPNEEFFYIQVTAEVNGERIVRVSSNAIKAADGFGKEANNPMLYQSDNDTSVYINWSMFILLIAFIGLVSVVSCQIIRYIECFKKSPKVSQLDQSHRQAVPNFYEPVVVYKIPQKKVTIKS